MHKKSNITEKTPFRVFFLYANNYLMILKTAFDVVRMKNFVSLVAAGFFKEFIIELLNNG